MSSALHLLSLGNCLTCALYRPVRIAEGLRLVRRLCISRVMEVGLGASRAFSSQSSMGLPSGSDKWAAFKVRSLHNVDQFY
jgi:hypothetical protein